MFINILATQDVTCNFGTASINVPAGITNITALVYGALRVGVPLLLIIFGMLDLGKAVMQQKEEDIKKAQNLFVKRLIAAALVFLVLVIVEVLVTLLVGTDKTSIWNCVKGLLDGKPVA